MSSIRAALRPRASAVLLTVVSTVLVVASVDATPSVMTESGPDRAARLALVSENSPHTVGVRTTGGHRLWWGGFDRGGVPHGANGRQCRTGASDGPDSRHDQYSSVQEMGNTACTNSVSMSTLHTRTSRSRRSLKIVMGARQQREQLSSKYTWRPNSTGKVDQWYGFSLYYSADWNMRRGLLGEVSGSAWHNPVAWRMDGDNGSLNLSGDMNMSNVNGTSYQKFGTPHMILRRNTLQNQRHLYRDGKGLDKLDLGPIVTNQWMDFVCHIRWSTTSTNALRECWRNGKYMGARHSRNAVSSATHRLRIGQYQTTDLAHARTTYADNVRIGTSYAAVDPSR